MAPLNYQHQQDRHLEDGLAPYGDEKVALNAETTPAPQTPSPSPPRSRKMNLRRFTVTCGLGLLVGFGLVTASRSRSHRPLCSEEIHASNDHEMKALVEQTKDDTSALSEMLRCASPETFHRLVSVYFPDQAKPESQEGRADAIGKDEKWLLTAWEKLVKRQDDGSEAPSTPADSATDDAGDGAVSETATVTQEPASSDPPVDGNQDPSTTDPVPGTEPEPTASDPPQQTETQPEVDEPTSTDEAPASSTQDEIPASTTEEPASSEPPPETPSSTSSSSSTTETQTEESTTEADTETSTSEEPEPSTTEDEPPVPSSTSSSSEPAPTAPEETTSDQEEDRPSKTTIHIGSSAVRETITSVNDDGGTVTLTSTSWVAVDPPEETGEDGESDPSLQDAGMSLRANIGPAALIGGIVTVLLMS